MYPLPDHPRSRRQRGCEGRLGRGARKTLLATSASGTANTQSAAHVMPPLWVGIMDRDDHNEGLLQNVLKMETVCLTLGQYLWLTIVRKNSSKGRNIVALCEGVALKSVGTVNLEHRMLGHRE